MIILLDIQYFREVKKMEKSAILTVLFIITIAIVVNVFYVDYETNKNEKQFTIENLNLLIENSQISSQLKFNTYNNNYIGENDFYIYCNLESKVQSFLINTYFYNFKNEISFYDFIFEYGYSNYYLFSAKK